MNYKVEAVNGCTKKLVFSFDSVDLTKQITAATKSKQQQVSLKGFRKGKAPIGVVQQFYGYEIEMDALNRFVQDEFFAAVDKEGIKMVGQPHFENAKQYQAGKEFGFDALVETFPEFSLKDYSKYSFSQDKVELAADEVLNVRKSYLANKAQMTEITTADVKLSKGQFAVLNFQGVKEDGEEPESMKGEEFLLEIGSNQFIPGFEEGMTGMKKGEKKNIDLTFPSTYHAQDLQNAKVTFKVELLEIKEKIYPDFTDELAKEFGFASVEDFNTKTEKRIRAQKERQAKEKLHQEILEKLIEENSFDVPSTMIVQQEEYLKKDMANTLKSQGFSPDMVEQYFSKWATDLSTKAIFQVKSGLILDKLASEFKVESTEADLDAKISEMAVSANVEEKQVRDYYKSNNQIKKNLMYAIREEKTFAKILEKVKLK